MVNAVTAYIVDRVVPARGTRCTASR
jgi:hypothetical protein